MTILLFHGTEILALFAGAILGFGIFVGMLVWAFSCPVRSWTIPAAYLVIGLFVSLLEISTDNFFGLAVMFAFPWSILLVMASEFMNQSIGLFWQIPCIVVNAGLVYLIANYQSR